jgi:AraC family transcriptional regulator
MLGNKLLLAAPDFAISVCRYSPGERHRSHTDRFSRIGFLIAGGYREEGAFQSIRMRPGDILLKSRRARHEDQFGESGATIVSIEFVDDDPFERSGGQLWHRRASAFALRHFCVLLDAARARDVHAARAAGADLASAAGSDDLRQSDTPGWLDDLRHELEETGLSNVDVAVRARTAGVHPAQASRLFRRRYGCSLTEHARLHAVRRAIGNLADDDVPLSQAAVAAGFYDQSHMNRAFRRVLGRTPGAQRRLFAEALGQDRPMRSGTSGLG